MLNFKRLQALFSSIFTDKDIFIILHYTSLMS